MSLRRRITAAVAFAVAPVAITLGVTGYLSTRSHLIGELQQERRGRAAPFVHRTRLAPAALTRPPREAEGRGHPEAPAFHPGGRAFRLILRLVARAANAPDGGAVLQVSFGSSSPAEDSTEPKQARAQAGPPGSPVQLS